MSAFTKRQPERGTGRFQWLVAWLPACICEEPASAGFQGLVNKRTCICTKRCANDKDSQITVHWTLHFSFQYNPPIYVHYVFTTPTLQPLDTTMPNVPSQCLGT